MHAATRATLIVLSGGLLDPYVTLAVLVSLYMIMCFGISDKAFIDAYASVAAKCRHLARVQTCSSSQERSTEAPSTPTASEHRR